MRLLVRAACLYLAAVSGLGAATPSFYAAGADTGPWSSILGSVGFQPATDDRATILIARNGQTVPVPRWLARMRSGAYLILEGDSELGRMLGFRPTPSKVKAVSLESSRSPRLAVVWEHSVDVPVYELPEGAMVFARERWSGAPLVVGVRGGSGGVLWVALPPGQKGYERFPWLLHALADLGLTPPFRSRRLWAFFDTSYRLRADLDYLASRWRRAGIRGLQVAAWHYYEPNPEGDAYLRGLIETCHRHGILVYAWLELPHVSEAFWEAHPEWREKTALLQDAQLDWRKLMNLANRDCFKTVAAGVRRLMHRFDWDGVNLAELYFESLEGYRNPSRFTPMNDDVRLSFRQSAGFDPFELFDASSPRRYSVNARGLRAFLDFRAALSRSIETEWLEEMQSLRRERPDLDVVLTQVDDRLDPGMRDAIGADTAPLMPIFDRYDFTLLIEDPATLWNLSPDRYLKIAAGYRNLTAHSDRLAIDINIAERYQNVYPTTQQTGTELFQLMNQAARAFSRVALYPEHAVLAGDVGWLCSAAAAVDLYSQQGRKIVVNSPGGVGITWRGPALVDGRPWPAQDDEALWLPPGRHVAAPGKMEPLLRLLDLTGELTSAVSLPDGIEFGYRSSSRALATVDTLPEEMKVDGVPVQLRVLDSTSCPTLWLPSGQHRVTLQLH